MGYTIKSIDGELKEYAFDFGGVIALRNFTARTNGNRLIIQSAENANFSILDALVNEVEIDGVVYNDTVSAQEALQRLVFNPQLPVIITKEERKIIEAFKNWTGCGLQDDTTITLNNNSVKSYLLPDNAMLFAFELQGSATLQVGSSESSMGDLGEITGAAGSVMQLGLLNVGEVVLKADTDIEIIPIIYKRQSIIMKPTIKILTKTAKCTDTGNTGKYTLSTVTITTNDSISTPAGWTRVSDTIFTKEFTSNGIKTLPLGETISITCIGTDSSTIPLPNITSLTQTCLDDDNSGTYTNSKLVAIVDQDILNVPTDWTRVIGYNNRFQRIVGSNGTYSITVANTAGSASKEIIVTCIGQGSVVSTAPIVTISQRCTDSDYNGTYDYSVLIATANQAIPTKPNEWRRLATNQFSRAVYENGTYSIELTNENGTSTADFTVNCIGKNSGMAKALKADLTIDGTHASAYPTGGTGNYSYEWSVAPSTCYGMTGKGNARRVVCLSAPSETCSQATITVVVSDGDANITKTATISLLCGPTLPLDVSNATTELYAKQGTSDVKTVCPYTIQANDDSYRYDYNALHSIAEGNAEIQSMTLTVKKGGAVIGTYPPSLKLVLDNPSGTAISFTIPKADLNVTGEYVFEVDGTDTNGKTLTGAKPYTCRITEYVPTITPLDVSNATTELYAKQGTSDIKTVCPYTIQAADDSYRYDYNVLHDIDAGSPQVDSMTLTVKRGTEVVGTYSSASKIVFSGPDGTGLSFMIPKEALNISGSYIFEVDGTDTNGKSLTGAKTYTCDITKQS